MKLAAFSLSAFLAAALASPVLAASLTPDAVLGTWSRGDAEIVVTKADAGYAVKILEGTCGDSVTGTAKLSGNILSLTHKIDQKICTITITFANGDAVLTDSCDIADSTCSIEGTYPKEE